MTVELRAKYLSIIFVIYVPAIIDNIDVSVDQYIFPNKEVNKSSVRR